MHIYGPKTIKSFFIQSISARTPPKPQPEGPTDHMTCVSRCRKCQLHTCRARTNPPGTQASHPKPSPEPTHCLGSAHQLTQLFLTW